MDKVKHDKKFRLEYEGKHWIVDLAEWRDKKTGKGELRAYRVDGDITDPDLQIALDLEGAARAVSWAMPKKAKRLQS